MDNSQNNIGYAGGCNLGAKKARGKYFLFLNSDTILLGESLNMMVNFFEKNNEIGILGPRIYKNRQKEKQLSFCRFPSLWESVFVYSPLKQLGFAEPIWNNFIYQNRLNLDQELEVDAVSGAALMIERDVFFKVGGFDENFFLYFEDNDLCRRVQKAGKKIVFFPKAEIIHFGGKSSFDLDKVNVLFKKSRYYFFCKYNSFIFAAIAELIIRFLEEIARRIR